MARQNLYGRIVESGHIGALCIRIFFNTYMASPTNKLLGVAYFWGAIVMLRPLVIFFISTRNFNSDLNNTVLNIGTQINTVSI